MVLLIISSIGAIITMIFIPAIIETNHRQHYYRQLLRNTPFAGRNRQEYYNDWESKRIAGHPPSSAAAFNKNQ